MCENCLGLSIEKPKEKDDTMLSKKDKIIGWICAICLGLPIICFGLLILTILIIGYTIIFIMFKDFFGTVIASLVVILALMFLIGLFLLVFTD
jgi:hypothetical protein